MRTLKMKQIDDKEEEIADALISLGMSRNEAMTLAYMQNANSATSIELEQSARLRQPEVRWGRESIIKLPHIVLSVIAEYKPMASGVKVFNIFVS